MCTSKTKFFGIEHRHFYVTGLSLFISCSLAGIDSHWWKVFKIFSPRLQRDWNPQDADLNDVGGFNVAKDRSWHSKDKLWLLAAAFSFTNSDEVNK